MSKKLCNQCGILEASANGLCPGCQKQNEVDHQSIDGHVSAGHSYHCACRMIWGDGECECGIKKAEQPKKYVVIPDPFPSVREPFKASIEELVKLNPGKLKTNV